MSLAYRTITLDCTRHLQIKTECRSKTYHKPSRSRHKSRRSTLTLMFSLVGRPPPSRTERRRPTCSRRQFSHSSHGNARRSPWRHAPPPALISRAAWAWPPPEAATRACVKSISHRWWLATPRRCMLAPTRALRTHGKFDVTSAKRGPDSSRIGHLRNFVPLSVFDDDTMRGEVTNLSVRPVDVTSQDPWSKAKCQSTLMSYDAACDLSTKFTTDVTALNYQHH